MNNDPTVCCLTHPSIQFQNHPYNASCTLNPPRADTQFITIATCLLAVPWDGTGPLGGNIVRQHSYRRGKISAGEFLIQTDKYWSTISMPLLLLLRSALARKTQHIRWRRTLENRMCNLLLCGSWAMSSMRFPV